MITRKVKKMFRCDYILNGECQLYSKPCKAMEACKCMNECSTCHWKHLSPESEPCCRCDALGAKKGGDGDGKH